MIHPGGLAKPSLSRPHSQSQRIDREDGTASGGEAETQLGSSGQSLLSAPSIRTFNKTPKVKEAPCWHMDEPCSCDLCWGGWVGPQKAQMLPAHAHARAHARKCQCEQPGDDSNSQTTVLWPLCTPGCWQCWHSKAQICASVCVSSCPCACTVCVGVFVPFFPWTVLTHMQTERSLYFSPFPAGLLLFICGSVDADQQEPVTHTYTHTHTSFFLLHGDFVQTLFGSFYRCNITQKCIHALWSHGDKTEDGKNK